LGFHLRRPGPPARAVRAIRLSRPGTGGSSSHHSRGSPTGNPDEPKMK
jgi:hypothetical protein